MMAQVKATSMISQNIANVSTTGYKRSDAHFHELVVSGRAGTWNGPGSVQATRILRADQQGSIQQTGIATDAAISGNGFFTVRAFDDSSADIMYTRNGTFSSDNEGYLRNTAGMILHGWQFDENGLITQGTDISSLSPVQINVLDTSPVATTAATLSINLDAAQAPIDPHTAGPQQLPAGNLELHYLRSITVYDGRELSSTVTADDVAHEVSFEFRRIVGPMAHFTTDSGRRIASGDALVGGPFTGINNGDTFTLEITPPTPAPGAVAPVPPVVPSPPETYTFVDTATGDDPATNQIATVQGLMDAIRAHGTADELYVRVTEAGQLLVQAVDPSVTITLSEPGPGTPLSGSGTLNIIQDPDVIADYIFEPDFDINGIEDPLAPSAYPNQGDFPAFANTTNPSPYGWWEMAVMIPDPADPSGQTLTEARRGLLNFNGDGTINALPGADGEISLDLLSDPIDFDPAVTGDEVGFTVDLGRMSQFAGNYNAISAGQNGAGAGERNGIGITADGIVQVSFTNGLTQNMFQIPLALFENPNGLNDISGTAFTESEDSGSVLLAMPGTQGAGFVNPAALEASNAEISDQFARMIVSQRGYTLSSKVISTIDQMTQRLSEMSR
jgi:flagellar hook protein FlgE